MLLLFNVHYNPEYYPEPHKFNPDNFSEEAVSSRPKYTFVPFANGARDCIGKGRGETHMPLSLIQKLI